MRSRGVGITIVAAWLVCSSAWVTPSALQLSAPVVWRLDNLKAIAGHSVTVAGAPRVVQTDIGPAVEFDGAADGLFLDVNPIAGLARFTVEIVFQPAPGGPEEQRFLHFEEATTGNRALIELRALAGATWALDTYLRSGDAGLTLLDRNLTHAAGRWHVAALTYDGKTMTQFVDGRRELFGATTFMPLSAGRTSIGVRQNRVSWFKGRIHSIRITPDALTADRLMSVPASRSDQMRQSKPGPAVVEPAVSEPPVDPVRDPSRTAAFVAGDSVVKDHGPGEGWGDYLAPHFDTSRIQVLNWAIGGSTARRFIDQRRWRKVLAQIQPGDFVLIQFGHDDRSQLNTFGKDLQQYARDARARHARPIFLSPVPGNYWETDGTLDDVMARHARLIEQVATEERVPFVDLNALVARVYGRMGRDVVASSYFTVGDATHTNAEGARINAATLADGIRSLPDLGLSAYLEPSALVALSVKPVSWAPGIEGQRRADLGNGYYLNPIVAGDRPDPSILKDGHDYYLTFSSFDAYPGLVIWHSRDLVNWRPITAALHRNVGSVWAPDLSRHDGRYYIYFPARTATYRSNYVIWADDIRGPWSDPVDLKIGQIDPAHAVGPDGRRYLFMSAGNLVPLAADGLSVTGAMRKIYGGWKYPADWIVEAFAQEGPKILRKGDYYYQVLAQGGTAGPPTGHMIVAARSKTIEGPWENSPYNPILRTESASERWWSKGHGTLVEGPDARWWVVYHAYENGFYNLGRQTLLEPIEWLADGWFRVAKYDAAGPIPKPIPDSASDHGFALSDDFSTNKMGVQWSFYKGTDADRARYRYENGLVLKAKGTRPADSTPLWFVTGDHAYELQVEIDADPGATAGLLLFYNERLYAGLGYSAKNFIMHSYGLDRPGAKPAHIGHRLHLRLRNNRHIVTIDYSVDGHTWERYDRAMEVSGYHHNVGYDFLSLRPALYAAGAGEVRFRNFTYRALP